MQDLLKLRRLLISMDCLVVFDGIRQDEKIDRFLQLLAALTAPQFAPTTLLRHYFNFVKIISNRVWRNYVIETMLKYYMDSGRSGSAHALDETDLDAKYKQNMARDLKLLQQLAEISPQEIIRLASARFADELHEEQELFTDALCPDQWPVWQVRSIIPESTEKNDKPSAEQWLKNQQYRLIAEFSAEANWSNKVNYLISYFRHIGYGIFGQYAAFKVIDDACSLKGLENLDTTRLENLICQEREQAVVVRNTKSFLQHYPANNVILYGNRGTGKSSLVKALLNQYVSAGLRLVELKKQQIRLFPELVQKLAREPQKFIIFIDDLSFDDVEEDYKSLKSLLEGGVEARPQNVLVYATSNRKHLVRESFAERRTDDVHAQDSMEEKLSLADRFGITVTFLSPDQETYLKIVHGLAQQNQIKIDPDELRQRALRWVMLHNGRSGRTARQFIDNLLGELAATAASAH